MESRESLKQDQSSSLGILKSADIKFANLISTSNVSEADSSLGLLPDTLLHQQNSFLINSNLRGSSISNGFNSNRFERISDLLKFTSVNDIDENGNVSDNDIEFDDFGKLEDELTDFTDKEKAIPKIKSSELNEIHSDVSGVELGPRLSRGVGCGVDSQSQSEIDTEDEIKEVLNQNRREVRPGLEGCNSLDAPQLIMAVREGAEGSVITSPVPGDGGGGGDGSSGHESESDSTSESQQTQASTFEILKGMGFQPHNFNPRTNDTRECPLGNESLPSASLSQTKNADLILSKFFKPTSVEVNDSYSICPWDAEDTSLHMENLQPRDLSCQADGSECADIRQNAGLSQKNKIEFSDEHISARSSSLGIYHKSLVGRDPEFAPKDIDNSRESSSKRNDIRKMIEQELSKMSKTNLGFNPFENLNPTDSENHMEFNDDDFLSGGQALEMINQDEEIFTKENKIFENDAMLSGNLGSSWILQDSMNITRPSWMSDVNENDDSTQKKVSFGKFIRAKTPALGSLDNKLQKERPYFGLPIITSPRSSVAPNALLDSSTVNDKTDDMTASSKNRSPLDPFNEQHNSVGHSLNHAHNDKSEVLSISAITKIISDASLSNDSLTMAELILRVSGQRNAQKNKERLTIEKKENLKLNEVKFVNNSNAKSSNTNSCHSVQNLNPYSNSTSNLKCQLNATPCNDILWEAIRPSSVKSRTLAKRVTLAAVSNEENRVRFAASPKSKDFPSRKANLVKPSYKTSTPYCADNFSMNFSKNCTSIYSSCATPKTHRNEIVPRMIAQTLDDSDDTFTAQDSPLVDRDVTLIEQELNANFSNSGRIQIIQDFKSSNTASPSKMKHEQNSMYLSETLRDSFERLNINENDITAAPETLHGSSHHLKLLKNVDEETMYISEGNVMGNTGISNTVSVSSITPFASVPPTPQMFMPLHNTTSGEDDQTLCCSSSSFVNSKNYFPNSQSSTLPEVNYRNQSSKGIPINSFHSSTLSNNIVSLQRVVSIKVPPELKFPEVACVGIATETVLKIHNPSTKFMQCNLRLISLTINGQSHPIEMSSFIFKQKIVVEPSSTEDVKILYASRIPGVMTGQLQVTSQQVTTNAIRPTEFTNIVNLYAEAEHPNIQILMDGDSSLDFGTIPEESCTTLNLSVINMGRATVPIRLVIQGSSTGASWQSFYFPKKNIENVSPPLRHLLSSNIISCTMPGHANIETPLKVVNLQVSFRAPPVHTLGKELVASIVAVLNVEVDVPVPNSIILQSIPMTATVGTIQLDTLKDTTPIILKTVMGTSAACHVPLRNSGSIPLLLEVTIQHSPQFFNIHPHTLNIPPGELAEIVIQFLPKNAAPKTQNVLFLNVCPGGPLYELQMFTEIVQKNSSQELKLESNKHYLIWGGVALGSSASQTFQLRNNISSGIAHVHVAVKGSGENFWLLFGEERVQSKIIILESNKEHIITVLFVPTLTQHCSAKIFIKPAYHVAGQRAIRCAIPVLGYGGVSNLDLVGLGTTDEGKYILNIGNLTPRSTVMPKIQLRNKGERTAFVKIIVNGEKNPSNSKVAEILVSSNEFIIEKGKTCDVVIAIRPIESSFHKYSNNCNIGTLIIYYGDEVNRRRYRRALNSSSSKTLPEEKLNGINFDVPYSGERALDEDELPATPNDFHLFFNGISCYQINLQRSINKQELQNSTDDKKYSLAASMDSRPLTSPPVRLVQPRFEWSIKPKDVQFTVQERDVGSVVENSVYLTSLSSQILRFKLMSTSNTVTLTPYEGTVQPGKKMDIVVSLKVVKEMLSEPWESIIYARINSIKQEITVSVNKHSKEKFALKVSVDELIFPETTISTSSEMELEFKNVSSMRQMWTLSSISPPKVEKSCSRDEIYRTKYSVFQIMQISGQLDADQMITIPIIFRPLEDGTFTQTWNLISRDASKKQMKTTLKLKGQGTKELGKPSIQKKTDSININNSSSFKKKNERNESTGHVHLSFNKTLKLSPTELDFQTLKCNMVSCLKLKIQNPSSETCEIQFEPLELPFSMSHYDVTVNPQKYIGIPIHFKPKQAGIYKTLITLHIKHEDEKFTIPVTGIAVDDS